MNELATSLAGHDKGHIYAIVRKDEETAYLADGKLKLIEKPKKKNLRHIRRITALSGEVREALGAVRQNSDLVHVLRLYQRQQNLE